MTVELWKTGYFSDYQQAETTTTNYNTATATNQGTYTYCTSNTQSTFYGTASSAAIIDGEEWVAGPIASPADASLACGTTID